MIQGQRPSVLVIPSNFRFMGFIQTRSQAVERRLLPFHSRIVCVQFGCVLLVGAAILFRALLRLSDLGLRDTELTAPA